MTPQDFAHWLQGYFEMQDPHEIGPNQTKMIRDHLNLVFDKKTPELQIKYGDWNDDWMNEEWKPYQGPTCGSLGDSAQPKFC
jgi:hypothetical protein